MSDQPSGGISGTPDGVFRDIPELREAFKCALPLLFTDLVTPDFTGIQGTCFAISLPEGVVFLTAAHNVKSIDGTVIEMPIRFGPNQNSVARVIEVILLEGGDENFADARDVALIAVAQHPSLAPSSDFRPLRLDWDPSATGMRVGRGLAVAGYPAGHPTGNTVDESRSASLNLFHAAGVYDGPAVSMIGLHRIVVDTSAVGGPNWLSGAPVLAWRVRGDQTHEIGLAGLVVRGNKGFLHFVGAEFLLALVQREKHRLFPAPT